MRLTLGTAQFGMVYGINNKLGKPSQLEVNEMLNFAYENGIERLDTAQAYGDAEIMVGNYHQSNPERTFKIISKLYPNMYSNLGNSEIPKVINAIEDSIERLKVQRLDGLLLHTPTDFYNTHIMSALECAKVQGLVSNIGVSVYEMEHAFDVVRDPRVDYIQVMYNVFDQRVDNPEFWELAKKNQVVVFARSVFLQGLILMSENYIPENLSYSIPYLRKLKNIAIDYGMDVLEMAYKFALQNASIDSFVLGVDSLDQLALDIKMSQSDAKLSQQCVEAIQSAFIKVDRSVILPSLWKK